MKGRDGTSPTGDPSCGNTTKPRSNGILKSKEQPVPTMGICCIGASDSEPIPGSMDCWESSFRSKLENVDGVNSSFKRETSSTLITLPRAARAEERN